jgi:4'-phosphopantetheinyl transferase
MGDADEVHICWARTDAFTTTIDDVRDMLAPDEICRHDAYRFARDRSLYLATRILCRCTLGHFAGVEPAAMVFHSDRHGRPEIARPTEATSITFNLSNTTGMVVIAVARGRAIGVDAETLDRLDSSLSVAERMFAREEWDDVRHCPAATRSERFATYWTLKEAYGKARGLGLGVPLDAVVFTMDNGTVRVRFDGPANDDAQKWCFFCFSPTVEHRIALAVGCESGDRVRPVVREVDIDAMARRF